MEQFSLVPALPDREGRELETIVGGPLGAQTRHLKVVGRTVKRWKMVHIVSWWIQKKVDCRPEGGVLLTALQLGENWQQLIRSTA